MDYYHVVKGVQSLNLRDVAMTMARDPETKLTPAQYQMVKDLI